MKNICFSIITITYNAADVLEQTIQSIKAQSYENIEYIIVDGASIDNTISIAEKNKDEYTNLKKIKIISEPDNGIYDAMNKGLRNATGDYVWFLNAGDVLKNENVVAEIADIAVKKILPDIIYGETDLIDDKGNIFAERRLKSPEHLTWKSFRMGMLVCHQAFIVRRDITPEYDLQYRFSADFDWCIRCLKKATLIVNSNLRMINYQYEGTTTANRKASLKERYQIMCKYYGIIPTQLRHIWFAIRFYYARIFKNNS